MKTVLFVLLLVHSALQYDLTCKLNTDCPANANCMSERCMCIDGYSDDVSDDQLICVKDKRIGDVCQQDKECEDNLGSYSECRNNPNGTCQCQLTYHFAGGSCRKDQYLGDSCTSKDDCVNSNPEVKIHCTNKTCSCPVGFHASSNKSECFPDAGIEAVCEEDSDCFVANSSCRGRCHCIEGFVTNNNKNKCLPLSPSLDSSCLEDNQCRVNMSLTFCNNGSCDCTAYSHRAQGRCYISTDLGGSCTVDLQCVTKTNNRSTFGCINRKCQCKVNYKPVDGDCVRSGSSTMQLYSLLLIFGILFTKLT